MAGFEVVVRPVVFPNIRPAPPRVLAPEDDPTQGIAVISGSGGKLIDLPRSWSVSVSYQKPHQEAVRQFDKERVFQKDEKGNINKQNYIDVERLKRVRLDADEGPIKMLYADPPKVDNVETLETDVTRKAGEG
jgi:hypothetical protein